jgi:Putative transposase/Transposase zinc-binding domain
VNEHRLEVADVFRQHKQEFFARWGDLLSPQQHKVFRDICACRTAACGARVEQCDHCSLQTLAFNSCRNRHCTKCQSRARDQWLARTAKELLPVGYCHVVFTLPGQLTGLALQNPRLIYDLLFRATSETLLTIAADPHRLGAEIGFLAVLHTWNQQMRLHPHLHCLVPSGGIAPDHSRWILCRRRFFLPVKVLGKRFRRQFLLLLSKAYRRKKLRLTGALAHLNNTADFDRLFYQLQRLNWVVYAKRPFGGPEHMLHYLARYTHRVAISNGRLLSMQDSQVTFRWRDSRDGNKQKLLTLDAIEFIHRFLLHVLPSGFVKIRHFGFLANAKRRAALELSRSLLNAPAPQNPLIDPQQQTLERRCPSCGIGHLCLLGWVPAAAAIHLPTLVPIAFDSS